MKSDLLIATGLLLAPLMIAISAVWAWLDLRRGVNSSNTIFHKVWALLALCCVWKLISLQPLPIAETIAGAAFFAGLLVSFGLGYIGVRHILESKSRARETAKEAAE